MRVFAYCTLPAKKMVKDAVGIEPLTSPPSTVQTFNTVHLIGADIIYFRLHGLSQIPGRWFGEDNDGNLIAAIGREQIQSAVLDKPVVILANCYGASSPMVEDFYQAGASVVIAGSGPNYASGERITGTDLLALEIIKALKNGLTPEEALKLAKLRLIVSAFRMENRDTLEFHIMEKTS